MNSRIKKLQDRKAALVAEMDGMLATAEAEDRDLTDEETKQYEAYDAELDAVSKKLAREERLQARERELDAVRDRNERDDDEDEDGVSAHGVRHNGERILKDPARGFRDLGEFSAKAFDHFTGQGTDERLRILGAATGMNQNVGPDGGYTVPPQFSNIIWDGLNQQPDSLLSRCDVYTVEGESLTFNANAETSRVTGSRYGGIQAYWLSEAEQIGNSKPKFRQIKLEPQEVGALVYLTNKLLRNSAVGLEQYVTRAVTEEINWVVSEAIFSGDGNGKPLGFLEAPATVTVAKESGQAAATIVAANVNKMWSRMHARAREGAVWLINQDTEPQLETLSVDVGTGGMPVYLPPGGLADAPNARLKGRPVLPIEHCETLGTKGDIVFVNLGYYAVGVRGTVETAMSMHLRFDYAETALRFMWAVDGQPWLASAITPAKGNNTLSPFVALATRA